MTSLETSAIFQSSRTCHHKKIEVKLVAYQSALPWVDGCIAFQPKKKEIWHHAKQVRLIQHMVTISILDENYRNADGQMTRAPSHAEIWSLFYYHFTLRLIIGVGTFILGALCVFVFLLTQCFSKSFCRLTV